MWKLQKFVENIINEDNQRTRKLNYTINQQTKKLPSGSVYHNTYFNLENLEPTDAITLVDKFRANRGRMKDGSFNPNGVSYSCPTQNTDPFLNGAMFNGMYKYLSGTGRYDMPSIDILKIEIEQGKYDIVSSAERKAQGEKYDDLFEHIITSLDDPKTIELLQSISKIGFNVNEEIYGKVVSVKNAMRTYAVRPDAVFVATRKTWKKEYNRILIANPKPIYLWATASRGYDYKKAEDKFGVSFNQIKDNPHKKLAFKLEASDAGDEFFMYVAYDVSDTMVIPNEDDLWSNTPGLANNLTGVLNQFAMEEIGGMSTDSEKLNIPIDEEKNKIFNEKMLAYLSNNKYIDPASLATVNKLDTTKDETVLALLKFYYKSIFDREHDNNIKNSRIVAAVVTTLTIEGLAETKRLQLLKTHEENVKKYLKTRKDFAAIAGPVQTLAQAFKSIKESNMNESQVTPEFIMNLFGVDPNGLDNQNDEIVETNINDNSDGVDDEKQNIKEEFYSVFNKLRTK